MASSDLSESGRGVIFEYDPLTAAYTVKALVPGIQSYGPGTAGTLVEYNNKLYGTASSGGAFGLGEIFSFDPATGIYSKLLDFDDSFGSYPNGKLTVFNNKMYGAIATGGATGFVGGIFEFDPLTNVCLAKADVADAGGAYPSGNLTLLIINCME